jgi:hypothetical protein
MSLPTSSPHLAPLSHSVASHKVAVRKGQTLSASVPTGMEMLHALTAQVALHKDRVAPLLVRVAHNTMVQAAQRAATAPAVALKLAVAKRSAALKPPRVLAVETVAHSPAAVPFASVRLFDQTVAHAAVANLAS